MTSKITWLAICTILLLGTTAKALMPMTPEQQAKHKQKLVNIAWQLALEAADFSPGIIDGQFGRKSKMALTEYAAANFPGLSPFDKRVFAALDIKPEDAITNYTITADDLAQVGHVPDDWNEKAKLDKLKYETIVECLAEKFHCSQELFKSLNPMQTFEAGRVVSVPNIRPFPIDNKPVVPKRHQAGSTVQINLAEKTIRLFDSTNKQIALFHCSIAKDKAKLPARDTSVQTIAAPNPNYTFKRSMWPEVKNVTRDTLIIPPGPRNPVGLAWVSLDLPGYGIHGTPKPEMIGKTGSHGCFRLTNWDALKFAGMVKEGTVVKIANPEK